MPFVPPEVLLLGPGPSPTSAGVQRAQAMPLLGHLDAAFLPLLDQVQQRLRALFGTGNALTLPIAGTGTAGMEAVVANLVARGDRVVVGVLGVFGQRFAEAVRRRGGEVATVKAEFGAALDAGEVARAIAAGPTRVCCFVHAETSTGVLTDLAPIAAAAREAGALLAVDCVTSLGGMQLDLDGLGVDAAFSGTQKCLSAPPGLSPVTFSARALAKAQAMDDVPYYFDTRLLTGYFGPDRAYHYTAPISMLYALAAALDEVADEGMVAREARHRDVAAALRAGLPALGLEPLVPVAHATPMLTTIRYPAGVDDRAFRTHLRQVHRIEVGGGLGPLAGRVFRVGLMGHGARRENVLRALAAFGDALGAAGCRVDIPAALAAARQAAEPSRHPAPALSSPPAVTNPNEARIRATIDESIATKQRMSTQCLPAILRLCDLGVAALRRGGKILLCGNGGSSCDAAHAAGELVGWFEKKQRPGYAAIALGHQVPALTAIANDVGYEQVFAREVEAIGRAGDLLVGFTTSGGSKNVVAALQRARGMGLATAVLCGEKRGAAVDLADVAVMVPSSNTARIQECHLVLVHVLCAAIEDALGS